MIEISINGEMVQTEPGYLLADLVPSIPWLMGRDVVFEQDGREVHRAQAGQRLATHDRTCVHGSEYAPGLGYPCGRC